LGGRLQAVSISIERAVRIGLRRWDAYLRLVLGGKGYVIYMPMLPRKPERAEALVSGDGKRIFIRVFGDNKGVCSCELDLSSLESSRCYNISCMPGSTWVAEEDIIRNHIRQEIASTGTA